MRKLGVLGVRKMIDDKVINSFSTGLSTDLSTNNVDKYVVIDRDNEIHKSNRLIESSYRLTTAQNRLLYMAMSKLKRIIVNKNMNIEQVEEAIKTAKFDMIYIDVIDYKKKFNIKANNLYTELAKITKELYDQEIIYFDDEDNIYSMRWVITAKYENSKKAVGMQFHPELIKDLLIFKNKFTRMMFDNFINIKGKYSFRIYELCKQYAQLGRRDFYIEDLRFKLGIKDEEYKTYSDFKSQVINPTIKEINKNTDISIQYEVTEKNKKTRKVEKVRFIIESKESCEQKEKVDNQQLSFISNLENCDEHSIIHKLSKIIGIDISAGVSEAILTSALEGIDEKKRKIGVLDYIKEKVEICDRYNNRADVENYIGLLISALKKDWKNGVVSENIQEVTINGMGLTELENNLLGNS